MRKITIFIILVFACLGLKAQNQSVTTLILVRHAEKADDGTKNPPLSEAGSARAQDLVRVLSHTKVDAIFSTPYHRTMNTVQPLANAKGLDIQTYDPMKGEAMDKILEQYRGGTVIVCGHSNTTPWVANYFLDKKEYADFSDSDYDNLMVLSVVKKGDAAVTWLTYGNSKD